MIELVLLVALQIKHWCVDFALQTDEMAVQKGNYGCWLGLLHSVQHGVGTLLIFLFFTTWWIAAGVAIIDFATHYHIDWFKMNYGCRDIKNPKFWKDLGLDQMAHQIVYIAIVFLVVFTI